MSGLISASRCQYIFLLWAWWQLQRPLLIWCCGWHFCYVFNSWQIEAAAKLAEGPHAGDVNTLFLSFAAVCLVRFTVLNGLGAWKSNVIHRRYDAPQACSQSKQLSDGNITPIHNSSSDQNKKIGAEIRHVNKATWRKRRHSPGSPSVDTLLSTGHYRQYVILSTLAKRGM